MSVRDRFDRIIIETTGLAEPGPVVRALHVSHDRIYQDTYITLSIV